MRDRSDASHAILDESSREIKASKVVAVLAQQTNFSKANVLDIGTGSGHMASYFGKHAREVHSVDVVDERRIKNGYKYTKVNSEVLPFEDSTFDIVISNHVIEHVTDQQKHLDEIFRVLKKGGYVYVATPSRLWITDPHYRLPFINWMPRPAAAWYLKKISGKQWDIRPVFMGQLRRMCGTHSQVSVLPDILKHPKRYNLDTFGPIQPIIRMMPNVLLNIAVVATPTIIVLFKKN